MLPKAKNKCVESLFTVGMSDVEVAKRLDTLSSFEESVSNSRKFNDKNNRRNEKNNKNDRTIER